MKNFLPLSIAFFSFLAQGQTDILNTDFQTGIPLTFTIVDNDGSTPAAAVSEFTSAWITKADPENLTDSVAASTSYFDPADTASRWLITPPLVLGAFGNFIEWEAKSHDASYPDDYLILISTTDNQISSFTDTIGYIIEEYFEWTNRKIDLSDIGFANQTVYIAFVNVTEDGFKLYVDDIHAWIEDPVGINEKETVSVDIYPNPSNGIINFKSEDEILNVNVLNCSNQLVAQTKQESIDLSDYPKGIYFLEIQTTHGRILKKVIIH